MLRKLALAAAATLFALLLAEAALRLAGVGSSRRGAAWYAGGNHPRFLFEPDDAAGYRLRPGFAGLEVSRSGEFQTAVRVDERRLRADGQRELALGDSMTFGEGVAAEEAWPARDATAKVARELERSGLSTWRLDDLLSGADPAWRYPRDRHWNRAGHERVAAALEAPVRALLSAPAHGVGDILRSALR